jgi:hypothetical protein
VISTDFFPFVKPQGRRSQTAATKKISETNVQAYDQIFTMQARPKTLQSYVARYPLTLERIRRAGNLESLEEAAVILRDAIERRKNYSPWVLSHYGGDPVVAVNRALGKVRT